jgi:hypothetical protein
MPCWSADILVLISAVLVLSSRKTFLARVEKKTRQDHRGTMEKDMEGQFPVIGEKTAVIRPEEKVLEDENVDGREEFVHVLDVVRHPGDETADGVPVKKETERFWMW